MSGCHVTLSLSPLPPQPCPHYHSFPVPVVIPSSSTLLHHCHHTTTPPLSPPPPHPCPHRHPISVPIVTPPLSPSPPGLIRPHSSHLSTTGTGSAPGPSPGSHPRTPAVSPRGSRVPPGAHHGAGHGHATGFLVIAIRHLRSEVLQAGGRAGGEGVRVPPWGSALPGTPPYSLRQGLGVLEGLGVPGGQAVQGCHLCQGGRAVPARGNRRVSPSGTGVPVEQGASVGAIPTLSPLGPVSPLGPCRGETRWVVRKGVQQKQVGCVAGSGWQGSPYLYSSTLWVDRGGCGRKNER